MAEFDYILAPEDQLALYDFLLGRGAHLVPHLPYVRPEAVPIARATELQKLVEEMQLSGPVFVSWPSQQAHPYEYYEIAHDYGTRYYLKQKHGGPYLDLLPSRIAKQAQSQRITTGYIAYFRTYYVAGLGQEVPVTGELRKQYTATTGFLRSTSKRCRAGKHAYWVGPKAREGLLSGDIIPPEGLDLGDG